MSRIWGQMIVGLMFGLCSWNAEGETRVVASDWPMLAHDPARSGATLVTIRPPFVRKWYRVFPDEGLMAGVQPVVADGVVYVGTLHGRLHAIDADTGADRWVFQAGGAILHAAAVAKGLVFLGAADGKLYALKTADGRLAWTVATDAAVWNAPLYHAGVVLIGSRDGRLYAVRAETGQVLWTARTGGPLLASPALDVSARRVYVASEDMRVYAVDFDSGQLRWRSVKLPGATFRGYHPVVAPDGAILVTSAPVMSQDMIAPLLQDMVREIFGDYANWRHTPEENARLRAQNFQQLAKPETYLRQLEYLRQRLSEEPAYQSLFVLDPADGTQRFVAPVVYAESMNGTASPPVVTPDGRVIVKYQVLLRSRYEHYSPFLNVGYLDTRTGHITPLMDQTRTYGWHDSLLLIHDEQSQLCVAGRVLINTHQDNVNALDLDTLRGYNEPFCTNIHEPQPGEALGLWLSHLRHEPLPVGKEWLIRGTAVYGGGSAIDVPVSVAHDSFYYLPTHELNSGCAVIAYRMHRPNQPVPEKQVVRLNTPTPAEQDQLRALPWDWDVLQAARLQSFVELTPPPGTRLTPRWEAAQAAVQQIPDAELDRLIWSSPETVSPPAAPRTPSALGQKLDEAISELIREEWQPLVFPAGKHPVEAYRFFAEPTEILYTLARALPHLDPERQRQVREYVAALSQPGKPLDGPTGQPVCPPHVGRLRSAYDLPPEKLWRVVDDVHRIPLARLYPLWLWAAVSGDWSHLQQHWPALREFITQPPNSLAEDCRNGYAAGLIAACRIAQRFGDEATQQRALLLARQALRERLTFELAHPRGAVLAEIPVDRHVFARWRNLTPEIARLLATYAGDIARQLIAQYVDYHRPTWWLAWNVELAWRNESPFSLPTMAAEIFAAKALIVQEPAERLQRWLDIPWCQADLYYIQKLVWCLEAEQRSAAR